MVLYYEVSYEDVSTLIHRGTGKCSLLLANKLTIYFLRSEELGGSSLVEDKYNNSEFWYDLSRYLLCH